MNPNAACNFYFLYIALHYHKLVLLPFTFLEVYAQAECLHFFHTAFVARMKVLIAECDLVGATLKATRDVLLHFREGYVVQTCRPFGEHYVTMDKRDLDASGHRGIRGRGHLWEA